MLLALITTATIGSLLDAEDLYGPLPAEAEVASGDARGLVSTSLDPEDLALILPRVLLLPVHVALTAAIWPIDRTLSLIDEHRIVQHVEDLLYNDARTAGVLPILIVLPGHGPSAGLKLFHDDAFADKEQISVSARFGGVYEQAYSLELAADRLGGTALWTELEVRYDRAPRLHFYGIGPELKAETFFSQERVLGRFRVGREFGEPGESLRLGSSIVYNHRRFGAGHRLGSDRSIESSYDPSTILGFEQGIDLVELTADLLLDFTSSAGLTPSGFFAEAFAGGAPPQGSYAFVHYGFEGVLFIDLFHGTRILALRAGLEAVEGGVDQIPFSELPKLGGQRRLRGYPLDSLRDEKALFASIEYRWPVHANLEAHAFLDAGKVAPSYRQLARNWGSTRFGGGAGLLIGSRSSLVFALDVAYGDGIQFFVATDIFHAFARRTEEL